MILIILIFTTTVLGAIIGAFLSWFNHADMWDQGFALFILAIVIPAAILACAAGILIGRML